MVLYPELLAPWLILIRTELALYFKCTKILISIVYMYTEYNYIYTLIENDILKSSSTHSKIVKIITW